MHSSLRTSLSLTVALSLIAPAFAEVDINNPGFYNGVGGTMYERAIVDFKHEGVMQGYPDGQFRPNNAVNRAEFLKILLAATGRESGGKNCFPDVTNQWFAPYVCAGAEEGIVKGYPDGMFHPESLIQIGEAAAMMARAWGQQDDGSMPWYKAPVEFLAARNALVPSIAGMDHLVTRGETAGMIWLLRGGEAIYERTSLEEKSQTYGTLSAQMQDERNVVSFAFPKKNLSVLVAGVNLPDFCSPTFENEDAEDQAWRDLENVDAYRAHYCPHATDNSRYYSYYTDTGTFVEGNPGGYEEIGLYTDAEVAAIKQSRTQERKTENGVTTWMTCATDERDLAQDLRAQTLTCTHYHRVIDPPEQATGDIYLLPNTDCFVPVGRGLSFGFRTPMAAMDSAIDTCEILKQWGVRTIVLSGIAE